jgi:PTH1 family peptidyl-tRNA hydrolase
MNKHNIYPNEILVVLDDLNLDIGKLRLRLSGSSGGHNGLKSIISSLETLEFPRLRIGIGSPTNGNNQIDHVLGIIPKDEHEIITATIEKACDTILCSLNKDLDSAMDSYN